jgi:8-oxo-dGTP pyrophosphatase MutT (NUDIX family)
MGNIYIGNKKITASTREDLPDTRSIRFDDLKKDGLENRIKNIETINERIIKITGTDNTILKKYFSEHLNYLEAAGGLVQNPRKQILFIFRHEKWDLPKGKPEGDENLEQTAIREVEEECGISGLSIIKPLPSTWHIYQLKNHEYAIKRSYWYHMSSENWKNIKVQIEEDITEARWLDIPVSEKILDNAFLSVKELVYEFQQSLI